MEKYSPCSASGGTDRENKKAERPGTRTAPQSRRRAAWPQQREEATQQGQAVVQAQEYFFFKKHAKENISALHLKRFLLLSRKCFYSNF